MKLGLFGRPVGHSRSPRLFRALGRMLGRRISYEAVEVKDGRFRAAVERARKNGWRGANVTIPFKLEAAAVAERLTPAAKVLGAVNTLRFGKKIEGHNTDGEGLRDLFRRAGIRARGKTAIVFGAGGAARAAAWALAKEKAKGIRFVNRTESTAKRCVLDLAPSFPGTSFSYGKPGNADIWINATPLGMKGHPDVSPAGSRLRAPETAVDLVYGRRTAFLRQAESLGAKTIDGSSMLVYQALRGWGYWDEPLGGRRVELAEKLIKEIA